MGFFSKAKDMYNLQKQTKAVKKDLAGIHIEAETDGVTVVMTAEQETVSVNIADAKWEELKTAQFGKKKLEDTFLKATNKALKKAQEIASAKMKGIWQQLGVGQ